MDSFLFRLLDNVSLFAAKRELINCGLQNLYIIEDDSCGETWIGGQAKGIAVDSLQTCLLVDHHQSISWEHQWEQFAEDFHDGKAHIRLEQFGASQTLFLLPGPGFGDLSHPTTYLMLELMTGCMNQETILDIGCGSGILSLAAVMMGAKRALGIDIDSAAIEHAHQNALINHLEKKALFSKAVSAFPKKPIVLINMILSEQREVLGEHPDWPKQSKLWIMSGILKSQRKEALKFLSAFDLKIIEEKKRGEWLGFKAIPS